MAEVNLVSAYNDPETIGILFREYTEMLIEGEPVFQKYLELQNYEAELTHLEEKYGMPEGGVFGWKSSGMRGTAEIAGRAVRM